MRVVAVRPDDVAVFGANAALLLAQIEYWQKRPNARCVVERGRNVWVAKSRDAWVSETGLTDQRLRNSLERLLRDGVLVRERHLHDNRVTAFLRVDAAVRTHIVSAGNTRIDLGPKHQMDLGKPTQTYTDEDCIEIDRDLAAAPPASGGNMKKGSGTVSDLLKSAGRKQAAAPVSVGDVSKPGQLEVVFKHAWAATYDQFRPNMTQSQLGQLKHVVERCPRGVAGHVVDHCVRHWQDFVSTAAAQEGAYNAPQLPSVGFLLRYVQSAVSCWQGRAGGGGMPSPAATISGKPAKAWKVPEKQQLAGDAAQDIVTDPEEAARLLGLGE